MEMLNKILISFSEIDQETALIFWAVIFILAAIVEMLTLALVSIWFVFGGIAAFIAAYFGASPLIQLVLFVGVSLVMFFFLGGSMTRWLAKKRVPTNANMIIGKKGVVIQEINNDHDAGRIMIEGLDWNARTVSGEVLIPETLVEVKEIKGATVYVESVK